VSPEKQREKGYEDGSQMKRSGGPGRLLRRSTPCPSRFDALHSRTDLLEDFGLQNAFSMQLLEHK